MDLSNITARVRPRNPHEAADLGIVMARQWFKPLMLLGVLPSLPVMLILFLLMRDQSWWVVLIMWWLKPLWETLQLQFIAEALFNPAIRWQDIWRKAGKHLRRQFFSKLLLQRWSLSRSYNMPVGELENLSGAARSRRLSTLHRDTNSTSVWLTIMGNTVEGLLVVAVFGAVWLLVPMKMEVDFEFSTLLDSPFLFPTIAWIAYGAMAVVSPFYVCAGFMLYINRRTWLEAWDIELTFRQLASKSGSAVKTLALIFALALPATLAIHSYPAQASTTLTPQESQQQIVEILESDDFNEIKQKNKLRWIEDEDEEDDKKSSWLDNFSGLRDWLKQSEFIGTLLDWLAGIPHLLEAALWGSFIALVVFLLYRYRHLIMTGRIMPSAQHRPKPSQLFGLELSAETLPDDVLTAARQLWQQQQPREALSLLYRAALSSLVNERHVPLDDSHTESECETLCRQQVAPEQADYFQRLTQHWITLAYAHRIPDQASFEQLCQLWPAFAADEGRA